MPSPNRRTEERLPQIVETQRTIAAAGNDLQAVMELIADHAQAIIGADGAMVSLIEDGDKLRTRAASGTAMAAVDAIRPMSESVARFAIQSGQPLLIEDAPNDDRINQVLRAKVGDTSLICVPLFQGPDVIGALNVVSCSDEHRLSERDRQTLELLSVMLSAAISNAAESEAKRAQGEALARFRTLFDGASIGILRLDDRGFALEANPALEEMLGYTAPELAAMRFSESMLPEDRAHAESMLSDLMRGQRESFTFEARYRRRDGEVLWTHVRAVRERGQDGEPGGAVAMIENVTMRKHAETELIHQAAVNEHQALHDPLTGLPNRLLFHESIGQAILRAVRQGGQLAVVIMDLNHFKEVNDTLGHQAGDELLKSVASRLRGTLRAAEMVARLGGDEFGLLLGDLGESDEALPVIERITATLDQPIDIAQQSLTVAASIGVSIFPQHGRTVDVLIQRADVAMYEAKRAGAPYAFYDHSNEAVDLSRVTMIAELRHAIEQRELVLHYQPKATLDDGEVRGTEALLRWQHPERGLIHPDAFIPLAQDNGLIGPLTLYVVGEALRQCRVWADQGLGVSVSVNLSVRNVLDLEFPGQVAALLARWNVAPELLGLEVTESILLTNPGRAKRVLGELAALGVRLAIDDFGTGYSSLAYLHHLPVDELKIDRSFVIGLEADAADVAIVQSAIDLGRNLGLDVVAVGVQTRAVWDKLRGLGATSAQGYLLSRPLAPEQFEDWLRERRASAARVSARLAPAA
jgi:diguanylate cyclase (GGDEF)-like protein/PAS domain S-box-containing protein